MEPAPQSVSVDVVAKLIARTLDGDLSAFDQIVADFQAQVRAFFRSRMRDPHAADDLSQECFVIAYRRLADFDPQRPLGAWLRGIAVNVLRNHLRSRGKSVVYSDEIETLLAPVDAAPSALETDDAVLALRDCLKLLAPDAGELVKKRYIQGLSVAEICRLAGMKHSAATMALHRVRLRLKECVGRKLPGLRSDT
jgi:RNA polymerase sigma-70 factor (ECF subfamily)